MDYKAATPLEEASVSGCYKYAGWKGVFGGRAQGISLLYGPD